MKTKSFLYKALFLLFFIYTSIVAFTCIPCSDDIFFRAWTFDSIIDMFTLQPNNWGKYTFAIPYNGRYLGNIVGLLLGKSYNSAIGGILRGLFITSSFLSLFILLNQLLGKTKKHSLLLAFLLVLTPVNLYSQVIHWTAGFSNYFLPVLGILSLFLLLSKNSPSAKHRLLIVVTTFATQLFSEHVTVYVVMVLFFCMIQKHKSLPLARPAFIAAIMGAVTMFSNPGYFRPSPDNYRNVGLDTLIETARTLAYDVIIGNGVLLFLIATCFLILLSRNHCLKKQILPFFIYILTTLYALIRTFNVSLALEQYRQLDLIIAPVTAILIIYFTLLLIKTHRNTALFHLLSLLVINGMLMFLSPINARCAFISFIILLLFTFSLMAEADFFADTPHSTLLHCIIGIMAISYSLYLTYSYHQNYAITMEWEQYCEKQYEQHAEVLYIPKIPYPHLTYDGNSIIYFLYGVYYDEPNDIYMEMHDYDYWITLTQQ